MLKLLRLALTVAVLAAIVVRVRRRAAATEAPALPPAPPPRPKPGPAGLLAAAMAALLGGVAFLGAGLWPRPPVEGMTGPGLIGGGWHATPRPPAPFALSQHTGDTPDAALTFLPDPPVTVTALPEPEVSDPGGPVCDPVRRPVAVRPLDPGVRRDVDRQWRRIERWLRTNAPVTYARLNKPGRARTIAVAESQLGLDFPDDLRASLLRHDGARGVVPGGASLGVRQIRDAWRALCSEGGHAWWTERMIPIQRRGGEYAAVGPAGAVVRDGVTAAPSYAALLREVADALVREREIDGREAVVRRGVLRWAPAG